MSKRGERISRRGFFEAGAGLALGGVVGPLVQRVGAAPAGAAAKSRVVIVRSSTVVRPGGGINDAEIPGMLNAAVTRLLGEQDAAAAWKRIVKAGDVVGIKTNSWSALRTPESLESALRAEVEKAGVAPADVAVDDRGIRSNPVFARSTALINARPMRTHHWAGLGTCLKNMIMFAPQPSAYHPDTCATLGALWKLPAIDGKVRLNVLVMLTPQFHGVGPHSFSKDYVWPYGGLIVGTDPVAVDATGMRIIEAKREQYFGERRPISPPPHHIRIAGERYGLGQWAPERIEIVRVGSREGELI
jgi:hypothetical protein